MIQISCAVQVIQFGSLSTEGPRSNLMAN